MGRIITCLVCLDMSMCNYPHKIGVITPLKEYVPEKKKKGLVTYVYELVIYG